MWARAEGCDAQPSLAGRAVTEPVGLYGVQEKSVSFDVKGATSSEKRKPSKEPRKIDQQQTEKSIKRIESHLHGCSHARHELMEMQ